MTDSGDPTGVVHESEAEAGLDTHTELFRRMQEHRRVVGWSDASSRVKKLLELQRALLSRRDGLKRALSSDFGKCSEEVDLTEIVPVVLEIRHCVRHLERWMRPRKVRMPLPLLGTASEIRHEPKGVVLIISPWNFPANLTLGPLVSAIGAGNCAVLKPSELTPATSEFLDSLVRDTFDPAEVAVVNGDATVAAALLGLPFDHIFFTGSPRVGRIVMQAAAAHLTSVTLELGGKSPAFVTGTADLESSASAIAWGKFANAGQACVAPDYVLVDERVADPFVDALDVALKSLRGNASDDRNAADMARIIDQRHYERIVRLVDSALEEGARTAVGGRRNRSSRLIDPTVLTNVSLDSEIMSEEIFGPILPVVKYDTIDEALTYVNRSDPPLALYIFTAENETAERILARSESGGVVINDVGIHFANPHLPFGGIKSSGIGRSHGHAGFLAFSNERSVMRQRLRTPPTRALYPPYGETTRRLIDWFLRFVG